MQALSLQTGGDGAPPYEDPFIGAGEAAESRAGLCAGRMVYPTNKE